MDEITARFVESELVKAEGGGGDFYTMVDEYRKFANDDSISMWSIVKSLSRHDIKLNVWGNLEFENALLKSELLKKLDEAEAERIKKEAAAKAKKAKTPAKKSAVKRKVIVDDTV